MRIMSRFIEELRDELRGHTGAAIIGIVLMAAGIVSWVLGNHILEPLVDEGVYLGLVIMTCGPMLVTFGGMLCLMLLTTLTEERRDDPHQHLTQVPDVQDLDDRTQQRDQYDRIGDDEIQRIQDRSGDGSGDDGYDDCHRDLDDLDECVGHSVIPALRVPLEGCHPPPRRASAVQAVVELA